MKALVVGIDSASPILIEKWIDRLPNLRTIFQNGVHGTLESIVPPESVPAWQCFATGKNPAKIGVFGFSYIGRDRKLKKGLTTPDLGCFWDIASNSGMKVGVFNVPGTYPPYPLNGFMVSGFPVPTRKVWSYPRELMKRLDAAVGGYDVDVPLTKPTEMRGGEEAYLPMVERLHRKSLAAAKLLMQWHNPDLFMMTFQGIDLVHHDFWRYMDDPTSPYANVLRDWYVRMDDALGELRGLAGAEANVLVMSDHGSAPVSSALYINKYLADNGLLTVKGPVKQKGGTFTKLRKFVLRTLPPGAIVAIYKMTPDFISHKLTASAAIERTLLGLVENIDWKKTMAFSTGGHQCHIYVNNELLRGPAGIDFTAREKLVGRICEIMSSMSHPKTGEKLVPVFHRREDVFRGPYEEEAPDLCVELFTKNDKVQINPRVGTEELWSFSPHFSSIHTRDGFWSMAGPDVRSRGLRLDASLLDLAPTILRMLNLPLPSEVDGKVLEPVVAS